MAVVIHDFEVEVQPPTQAGEGRQQAAAQPPPTDAQTIVRVLERQQEREARVLAH
ncbi:MAG: hypothetical protein HYR56_11950 [Acidobacteria bacterium]|nr:hypothetical protein [Acidobacteriota bacterium]MBI3428095.1 hypothetical protein [Acidobacteriota bacterium]